MTIEIITLFLAFGAIALVAVWTLLTGSPPTPTSAKVRAAMLAVLPRRLPETEGAVIYELGAGWGGLAIAFARRFPDVRVVAVERSPLPYLVCRLRAAVSGAANLEVRRDDIFERDISDAVLVVCYLSADALARLRPKLEAELAPGALVLSHTFAVPEWRPVDERRASDMYRSPVYLYERSGAVAASSQDRVAPSTSGPTASATR